MTNHVARPFSALEAERRGTERGPSIVSATLRQKRKPNETVTLTDITLTGCGFRSGRDVPVGTSVWLGLPGIETWTALVAWFKDGRGGLSFEQPLQPMAAARYLSAGAE
jgi:hypothetical protein